MNKTGDLDQTRLALAALTASIVQALGEQSPAFLQAFEKNLEACYTTIREIPGSQIGAMETLTWVREILKDLK